MDPCGCSTCKCPAGNCDKCECKTCGPEHGVSHFLARLSWAAMDGSTSKTNMCGTRTSSKEPTSRSILDMMLYRNGGPDGLGYA
ncbi:hypothetical protein M440DRAFT_309434 [Trichoderma longibrachiatum ATCC 18648]|uniref:Metallothionein n=1 Tax=Trichoderma longibrachiatum ATCC 18648 TaxID=983965 RepID=A0A2T4C605_TRILO|nr:hypothetical protein M440DRAFT_309434 [Trichoderma longibrachiatum ATCC 18648]